MGDGQKTPHGHPDLKFYMKILRVFINNRQTNRQTDGENTRCVWAGGTFLGFLRKSSSSPFTICMCIARIRLEIHVNNK
jgi:hypothetical protein